MTRVSRTGLVLALTLFAWQAHAQHDHAQHRTGPNGGRLEEAGPWHAELVTKGETVAVYLSDLADKPLPVEGFSAVAILKAGDKAARIPLKPDGNRLAGRAEAALGARPTGAVRITGPGGATANARFQ